MARSVWDYSPKFVDFIKKRKLEEKKQQATYVGLSKLKGKIDVSSRVSIPNRIKEKDASQLISLINCEFLEIHRMIDAEAFDYYIPEMNELFNRSLHKKLKKWPFKTGLKSRHWSKLWFEQMATNKSSKKDAQKTRASS